MLIVITAPINKVSTSKTISPSLISIATLSKIFIQAKTQFVKGIGSASPILEQANINRCIL